MFYFGLIHDKFMFVCWPVVWNTTFSRITGATFLLLYLPTIYYIRFRRVQRTWLDGECWFPGEVEIWHWWWQPSVLHLQLEKPTNELKRSRTCVAMKYTNLSDWNSMLKSSFSEKATKIWKNFPLVLTLLSKDSCFIKILWP